MKTIKSILSLLAVASTLAILPACSDVELPEAANENLPTATALKAEADGREVVLTWQLPASDNIESIEVLCNSEEIATLPKDATSYVIPRQIPGQDIAYTVKILYADGLMSKGVTAFCDVVSTEKIAMLLPCALDDLTDDDEIAAAKWFQDTYKENGAIMTTAQISGLNVKENPVVWIFVDREGLQPGWRNLPSALISDNTITALKNYIAAGGRIYLAKHATQLTVPLGYLSEQYAPGIFGSGEGGEGSDIWAINCNLVQKYDHRGHEIFAGLTTCDQFSYPTYALEGPGWREDHNCMWDFNSFSYTAEGEDKVQKFENQNGCTVLATWGHVVDDAVGGILEFPTEASRGGCIANGLSAYEFNERTGNAYQSNIERLTKNTLDYLNK